MTSKYLFLDIDGVVNSNRTVHAHQKLTHAGRVKHAMVMGHPFDPLWDATAIGMLKSSQEAIGFKIVISSTWRILLSLEDFHTVFDLYDWDTREIIIGKTSPEYNAKRGTQIDQWLREFGKPEDNYCIMDDDSDMLQSQEEHFVKVDYNDGLSFANVTQMHTIFGVPIREL